MLESPAAMTETAIYLVCIGRQDSVRRGEKPGVEEGTKSRVVNVGAFDALVVDVPTEVFLADDAESRLQDVAWLTPRAERHEQLVREAMEHGTVMPVGFGSVFTSEDALQEALAPHLNEITEFLEDAEGAKEWSLKVWTSRAAAVARAKQQISEQAANDMAEGAAYLAARRLREEATQLAEQNVLAQADELIEGLDEVLVDAVERRATQPEDEPDRWLVAHVAMLIDDVDLDSFNARLDQLAAELDQKGIDLELSGPWPPYSFCPRFGDE